MASTIQTSFQKNDHCFQCSSQIELNAKFCGECGAHTFRTQVVPQLQFYPRSFKEKTKPDTVVQPAPNPPHAQLAPSFAHVSPSTAGEIPQNMKEELDRTVLLLLRERLFLYMHCLIFLTLHVFGLVLTIKAYTEYIGDELTKTAIAITPLLIVNSLGLVCLAPIKGTKREIARLKERLNYVRFQIEYRNII